MTFLFSKTEIRSADPPFFKHARSYNLWITSLCRWTIVKSKKCSMSRWKDFFFSCRTATRSEAGLDAAEFILPLLVLDRICFGSRDEFESIVKEFLELLQSRNFIMPPVDRQKALSAFFSVVDTLSYWAERETEESSRNRRTTNLTSRNANRQRISDFAQGPSTDWSAEDSKTQIIELLDRLPLAIQAQAASEAGMHARALLLLEKESRSNTVHEIYESKNNETKNHRNISSMKFSLSGINLDVMKKSLASLGDCDTMVVVGEEAYDSSPVLDISDRLLYKEKSNDFEGSLGDFERLLQVESLIKTDRKKLESGVIRCLLETGRFEEVLSRTGSSSEQKSQEIFSSYAAEASVRLGQWDALSSIVDQSQNTKFCDNEGMYRMSLARAMLCMHEKNKDGARVALDDARKAVMHNLSSFARENYSRCYPDIVRLQCIREAEDAATLLCSSDFRDLGSLSKHISSDQEGGWEWEGRLKLVAPASSPMILSTRSTIARLGNDPLLESSMIFEIGRQARKNEQVSLSERALTQAEAIICKLPRSHQSDHTAQDALFDDIRTQYAKLKHKVGDDRTAFRILGRESVDVAFAQMEERNDDPMKVAISHERERTKLSMGPQAAIAIDERKLAQRFAQRLLRLSKWTVSAGLEGETQSLRRFKMVVEVGENLEKGTCLPFRSCSDFLYLQTMVENTTFT